LTTPRAVLRAGCLPSDKLCARLRRAASAAPGWLEGRAAGAHRRPAAGGLRPAARPPATAPRRLLGAACLMIAGRSSPRPSLLLYLPHPSSPFLPPSHGRVRARIHGRGWATEQERGPCVRESAGDCLAPAQGSRSESDRGDTVSTGRDVGEREGLERRFRLPVGCLLVAIHSCLRSGIGSRVRVILQLSHKLLHTHRSFGCAADPERARGWQAIRADQLPTAVGVGTALRMERDHPV
jgi:hypothetical protein